MVSVLGFDPTNDLYDRGGLMVIYHAIIEVCAREVCTNHFRDRDASQGPACALARHKIIARSGVAYAGTESDE